MRRTFCLLALFFPALAIAGTGANTLPPSPDQLMAQSLLAVRNGRLAEAHINLDRLLAMQPDFRLARLVKADLLLAQARPLDRFGAGATAAAQGEVNDLHDEARQRLKRYLEQPDPRLMPLAILNLSSDQPYALLADASLSRLYLFENDHGQPRLVRDFYVSIGKQGLDKRSEGDLKTPVGVYRIDGQRTSASLPRFYGAGAFMLDYPNTWDRLHKRQGHGIWIHGVPPGTFNRPPRASDGCLVVSNADFKDIRARLKSRRAPVVIANQVEWVMPALWQARRQALLDTLDTFGQPYRDKAQVALFQQPEDRLAVAWLPIRGGRNTLYLREQGQGWRIAYQNAPGNSGTPAEMRTNARHRLSVTTPLIIAERKPHS